MKEASANWVEARLDTRLVDITTYHLRLRPILAPTVACLLVG